MSKNILKSFHNNTKYYNAESPAGTLVTGAPSAPIIASSTPGSVGKGENIQITAGAAITVNGVAWGGAGSSEMYYIDHTVFILNSAVWYLPSFITSGSYT